MKSNELNSEREAISCRLSEYFGFKLSENSSVLSVENVYCMNTLLIYHFQRAHDSTSDPCVFIF